MSINRIQKLLFSEYCDFEDMVLVESPFAQTTREGKGVRQVNLGLTPTKLVLATDVLPSANESTVTYIPGIDPDIETFELVAVYPVECLNLSIFHRRKRQSLKAHFCNNRILYFELGGFEKRKMFWNLWCERVKFLSPEDPGSSHSETSVATSTSNSTLYLLATRRVLTETGVPQLWCKYGAGDISVTSCPKWKDRHLYLGKNLEESPVNYTPNMLPPTISQFIIGRASIPRNVLSVPSSQSGYHAITRYSSDTSRRTGVVNRFGTGVPDGCISGLFLPAEDFIMQRKFSVDSSQTGEGLTIHSMVNPEYGSTEYIDLTESAVRSWELARDNNPNIHKRGRHRRRYGFASQPHFLNGLGPWSVPPGERYSVQVKRAVSAVRIRRQPLESELRLPISKRQLVASISCEALHLDKRLNYNSNSIKRPLKGPIIFFWTPEYWYRPRTAKDAYHELLRHLNNVRNYCQKKNKDTKKGGKRRFFKMDKFYKQDGKFIITDTDTQSDELRQYRSNKKQQRCGISSIFNPLKVSIEESPDRESRKKPEETSLQYLRRVLRMEVALTAWDFDSTTLCCQLTLIDRDLFLKIPSTELGVLLWQQTSKNAPNIGAVEAFSHRISCLVATEILRDDSDKIRARLIARLINTAEKCHKISNYQSCKSILSGLQSPAVYRLYYTWMYVRKRHATKYQIFESLCRLYRDPRLPAYQKAFHRASQERPYLPYIGDLISKLLGRINCSDTYAAANMDESRKNVHASPCGDVASTNINSRSIAKLFPLHSPPSKTSTFKRILSTLRLLLPPDGNNNSSEVDLKKNVISKQDSCLMYCEDDKITRLNKAVMLLEACQRAVACYNVKRNDLAREYLLKARYREDRENFLNSFSVEKQDIVDSGYICNY